MLKTISKNKKIRFQKWLLTFFCMCCESMSLFFCCFIYHFYDFVFILFHSYPNPHNSPPKPPLSSLPHYNAQAGGAYHLHDPYRNDKVTRTRGHSRLHRALNFWCLYKYIYIYICVCVCVCACVCVRVCVSVCVCLYIYMYNCIDI